MLNAMTRLRPKVPPVSSMDKCTWRGFIILFWCVDTMSDLIKSKYQVYCMQIVLYMLVNVLSRLFFLCVVS